MSLSKGERVLLAVNAMALLWIGVRPYVQAAPVAAQSDAASAWYFEPGVHTLLIPEGGQVLGKVAVDLRTGKIWGFPTYGPNAYPVSATMGGKPKVSHPFALGRFALEDASQ